ncbi:MAG: barstar family protein [Armatimonadetes bacterium]|nr:barstar family protein [Armatimonadota bacterium]
MNVYQLVYGCCPIAICLDERLADKVEAELTRRGFVCFHLDGSKMTDEHSFIHELVTALPCDPDYYEVGIDRPPNWDAVEDSLWGGGLGVDESSGKVAIFWERADTLLEEHLNLVLETIWILANISYGQKVCLKIFLLGQGKNFISEIPEELMNEPI